MLPAKLKAAAGIEKDIVTVGRGKRIEIWAADVYNKICADANYRAEFKKLGI
ncbi:MAG: division/cell wall cluster transcriptional repressor MraZ [Clostridia bacterium]|nr:division/cell wall cluster transcriptional repressor MraZ [Clostridia bacterium]